MGNMTREEAEAAIIAAETARRAKAQKAGTEARALSGEILTEQALAVGTRVRLAEERKADEERMARALAPVARVEEHSRLKASTDGYKGSSLETEIRLMEQDGRLTEEAKRSIVRRVKKSARKLTVSQFWDMVSMEIRAVGKARPTTGSQTTPWRSIRGELARQGMRMPKGRGGMAVTMGFTEDGRAIKARPAAGWPTRRVPGAIMRHKGDF